MKRFDDVVLTGGTGRSGTTVVGRLLSRHSSFSLSRPAEIKLLTSGNGLLDVHLGRRVGKFKYLMFNDWLHFQRFKYRLWNDWWVTRSEKDQILGLSQGINRQSLAKIVEEGQIEFKINRSEAMRLILRELIDFQKKESGKLFWIDTTPSNLIRADELSDFLPGVRFINMIRDGRDTISSVLNKDWGPRTYEEGLDWWRQRMLRIAKNVSVLGGSVITLSLEKFIIEDREKEYSRLLDFLKLKDEPRMKYFFNTQMLPAKVSMGRWRTEVKNPEDFSQRYLAVVHEVKSIESSLPLSTKS